MKNAANIRDITLITLFAFLMNVTLPFFVSYNSSNIAELVALQSTGSTQDELVEMFGEKILICTTSGYKWVSVKDMFESPVSDSSNYPDNLQSLDTALEFAQHSENDSNNTAPASHQFKCPLCFLNSQGISVAIPSLEIAINYPQKTQSISYSVNNVFAFSQLSAHQPQTRGPPAIV